jgi:hypothetical protein
MHKVEPTFIVSGLSRIASNDGRDPRRQGAEAGPERRDGRPRAEPPSRPGEDAVTVGAAQPDDPLEALRVALERAAERARRHAAAPAGQRPQGSTPRRPYADDLGVGFHFIDKRG